jgi:ribulose-5-phosphate 4-epimerase/fuculose-1-phosphate aldolase
MCTVGDTVDEAVALFVTLDRQCHVQLLTEAASANGLQKTLIDKEDAEFSAKVINDPHILYLEVCILPRRRSFLYR